MIGISFNSENLVVDWISFNIQGLPDTEIIAYGLSKHFTPHVLIDGLLHIVLQSNKIF